MTLAAFDAHFWLTGAAILLLLGMSAFFSGSETALTAASRSKLKSQADKGSMRAQAAIQVVEFRWVKLLALAMFY